MTQLRNADVSRSHQTTVIRHQCWRKLMNDRLFFLLHWMAAPLRTAAVAPSSRALARIMTQDIVSATGPVIELGPGTGVFTTQLLERGVAEQDIMLVELNPRFAKLLRSRFAKAQVMEMDAAKLSTTPLLPTPKAGAVLSGLGLPSMPIEQVTNILLGAFRHLRPDGAFYQFTYGPRCPVPISILESLNLEARRTGGTLFNIPPASVYRITSRQTGPDAPTLIEHEGDR